MRINPTRRDIIAQSIPTALVGAGLAGVARAQTPGQARAGEERTSGGDAPDAAAVRPGQGAVGRGSLVQKMLAIGHEGNQYRLPPLPYPYDALEPHIDEQTMKLHHDKHHQGYVDGLNKAIKELDELRVGGEIDAKRLSALERDLSFNGGGHIMHTVFWATLAPGQPSGPEGLLAEAIAKQFGSFDAFKNHYTKVALSIKGSGWAAMVYEPIGDRLMVLAVNEHDVHHVPGAEMLLPVDVWEHAYYLKYQNRRAEYVNAWWNVVNWPVVGESYAWLRSRGQESELITSGR